MSDEEEYESSQPGDDDDGEVSQETNDEGETVVCYYGCGFGLVLQSDCEVIYILLQHNRSCSTITIETSLC